MDRLTRFLLYTKYKKQIDAMSDTEAGILFKAIFQYVESGKVPDVGNATVQAALGFICAQIETDGQKYRVCRWRDRT